jgi:hypothetical protein
MKYFLPLILIFCVNATFGQDVFPPDSIKKTIQATQIEGFLKIDGKLDEPEWATASVATDFVQVEPYQRKKALHDSEFKLLYNKDFLYIGVFCKDSLGKKAIRVTSLRRDFDYKDSDQIGISIDGFNDERNSMIFMTDPYSSQRDLITADDNDFDVDWDGLWKVRTSRTENGWYSEFAIPWQTIRYQKVTSNSEQTWGINFFRIRRFSNEFSAWSGFPRSFSPARMSYAGKLVGIKPPPVAGANIRVQPYLLLSTDNYNGSSFYTKDNGSSLKAGGEMKWALTSNMLLDLTYNTDFAQADADRQVNNLSRLSIFFPERRQFFLENASLFGAGLSPIDEYSGGQQRIQPFFSRKIGLDANGKPIPIDFGMRLVNRSLKNNFGIMYIREQGTNGIAGTDFMVGRFSQNIGKQNRLGYLTTIKNTPSYNNMTHSIDGFFRIDPSTSVQAMAMISNSSNDKAKGIGQGYSGYYQLNHRGVRWSYWLTQNIVNQDFNPELGFVARPDVIESSTGAYWLNRGKWMPKWLRSFEPGGYVLTYHATSTGKLQERRWNTNPVWFTTQSGGVFGILTDHYYQNVDYAQTKDTLNILDINFANGDYNYDRFTFILGSDASKKVSYNVLFETGKYYNGYLTNTNFRFVAAPIPQISLTASVISNNYTDLGIKKQSGNSQIYSLSGRFALNPRLQLIGFYQRLTGESDLNVWNIRFSWEYKPLSFIYLVFNQRGFNDQKSIWGQDGKTRIYLSETERQTEQHLIAKFSYLKQF